MEALCTVSEAESTTIASEVLTYFGGNGLASQTLADWLREQLRRREWSQADFARQLGVGTGTVSRWMAGRQPDTRYCELIADVLNVDVDVVLSLAGHRPAIFEIDPNSPEGRLLPLIRAIPWTERDLVMFEEQLRILGRALRGELFNDSKSAE